MTSTTDPNVMDYRSIGGPLLSYLWCNGDAELSGQSLYLGAEIGSDGHMYCIPGHAKRVLKCEILPTERTTNKDNDDKNNNDPSDPYSPIERVTTIGDVDLVGKYKWLRGVRVGNVIYGLPCHADSVLSIHVPTQTVTTLAIPYQTFFGPDNKIRAQQEQNMLWKYHGGTISPIDGCIYCIPQSASYVLQINPTTNTCRLVGPELPGKYKWYGGLVGKTDQAIYGIPHNSSSVLRIVNGDHITLHGDDLGTGGHKWHGAAAAANGVIVSVPANADSVLCIHPGASAEDPPKLVQLGDASVVQTGRHRSDNKYKYLGAMTGPDGKVYCFPSGSERVLQVDTVSMTVRQVGDNLLDKERLCQNKWQNGLVDDRYVYAIPLAAESVLRIDCQIEPPEVTTWPLPQPVKGLAKWEGGIVAPNGVIYTVPNNHKAILRIESLKEKTTAKAESKAVTTTQKQPVDRRRPKDNDEHLPYRSGIPTLRSSAHRVKYKPKDRKHDPKPKNRQGQETSTLWLPQELLLESVFGYNEADYNIKDAVRSLLKDCDPDIVGKFQSNDGDDRLENFVVPVPSTWRKVNGGQCESAQKYLSDRVASDKTFLAAFDKLVQEVVLPYFKKRLVELGAASDEPGSLTFYYQRPPTLRLQPGPAWAQVKPHNDAEYGHQNGELNFWIPLTDRKLTGVDLWSESSFNSDDFHPIKANVGEIISFHGSSCRHYVNTNDSPNTRVSLDFRVGVEGFFDPMWEMRGTTDDHCRKEVRL